MNNKHCVTAVGPIIGDQGDRPGRKVTNLWENEKRLPSKFFSRMENTQGWIIKKMLQKNKEHCVAALGPDLDADTVILEHIS